MVISVARNISRRCSLQLSKFDHRISFMGYHHRQFHQQHRRRHAFFDSHVIGKLAGISKLPTFSYSLHSYRTFSSSSSSFGSKYGIGGFLKWYLGMLETRPFITKGISSSLIFAAADITSQIITLPPSGSFDSVRTLRIAGYGLLIMGPSQHLWFNFLSRVFPGRDVFTTVKKIVMGQSIYGPIMNSIFFSYNAALQGETREEVVARLKRDLLPTLMKGLMYWPLCDFLTFKFIPVHLQPLVNSSFAYLWTIYLTYMASLKKVGED
ncbi:protein SYM1 [Spinacia oleracea]|uniref:Protein SYM1 n=1 Tax=Spinacia oleracea TaxID=3562 RepID=A0A9R0JTY1_SPIOL|nr:protein SYM1-like [Spinacia oleracea]XP_056696232.1 protein SYM1-like [Spinacia oleracea]XP_056696233.1 protein SYM1-like [Spinacia oleracea]